MGWFWSHDIQPDQIDGLATPGFRLVRLSHYGRRFAALFHEQPGPPRAAALDLTVADLATVAGRPVAVTVDTTLPDPRFSVVLERAGVSAAHADLDAAGVQGLLDGTRRILDLDTYLRDGERRYVVVVEESPTPSLLFTDLTRRRLNAALRRHGATPVVVRPAGEDLFAAVAEPAGRRRSWHADLDADGVGRKLHRRGAYPVDLDAVRTERGVRFTVVIG